VRLNGSLKSNQQHPSYEKGGFHWSYFGRVLTAMSMLSCEKENSEFIVVSIFKVIQSRDNLHLSVTRWELTFDSDAHNMLPSPMCGQMDLEVLTRTACPNIR
jgi:hypothetical protein